MPRKKNTASPGRSAAKRKTTKTKRKPSKAQVKKFGRFLHEKFKTE